MPEAKGSDVRTLAVRVSPDFHAQLTVVAQVDDISLTDLMVKALEAWVVTRRDAPEFQAKAQAKIEEAEAQMARTRATLLGAIQQGTTDSSDEGKTTRRKA